VVGRALAPEMLSERVIERRADLVVAGLDGLDANTLEQFGRLVERSPCPVIVFTGFEGAHAIDAAVQAGVTAYIVDGFAPVRIGPIVQVALARYERERALKTERDAAQAKLAERKLVERAKGILMRKRGIGEDEAYQALRRYAMDKSLRMREVAERVIGMSDLLG